MMLCECGCGEATTLVVRTQSNEGVRAGEYRRYIAGHNKRKDSTKRYRQRGRGKGAAVHIQRAERALGKPLPKHARVHHSDGTIDPCSPLVICQDDEYHFQIHARMRTRDAGGNPWTDKVCSVCRFAKPRTSFHRHIRSYDGCQSTCIDCQRICDRGRSRKGRADLAPPPPEPQPTGATE